MSVQDKTVLVLGGGIAGATTALDLAEEGVRVVVVEKEDFIGGYGAQLACKALDACQSCNGCLVEPRLAKLMANPDITIHTRSVMKSVDKTDHGFKVTIDKGSADGETTEEMSFTVDAVVVATGYKPFPAEDKNRFGYGELANVITGMDLEEQLRRNGDYHRPSDGKAPAKVAFIQCVGSRDVNRHNYCSRVCCGYALRLGRTLHHRFGTDVTVFYMDIQSFGHAFDDYLAATKEEMRLVRFMPGDVFAGDDGNVTITYQPEPNADTVTEEFETVVLSVGITPGESNAQLAEELGLELDEHGFIDQDRKRDVLDGPADADSDGGVFLAGTVIRPMDVAEVVAQAGRTAQDAIRYLEGV